MVDPMNEQLVMEMLGNPECNCFYNAFTRTYVFSKYGLNLDQKDFEYLDHYKKSYSTKLKKIIKEVDEHYGKI